MLTKLNWGKDAALLLGTALGGEVMATVVFPISPQLALVVIAFCTGYWLIDRLTTRLAEHRTQTQQKWLWTINVTAILASQLLMLAFLPIAIVQHATLISRLFTIGLLDLIIGLVASLASRFLTTRDDTFMPACLTLFLTMTSVYYLTLSLTVMSVLLPLTLILVTLFNWTSASTPKRLLMAVSLFLIALIGQAVLPSLAALALGITIVAMWLFIRQRATFMKFLIPFAVVLLGFLASVPTTTVVRQAAAPITTSLTQSLNTL